MPVEIRQVPFPTAPSWRRATHVAIGLLALSAGAGELYAWPRLHALRGLDVAWLLIPAALIQLPLLVECQRVAVLTGESFLVALARRSRALAIITLVLVWVSFFWLGGWIAGSADALRLLLGFPQWGDTYGTLFWSAVLMTAFLLPLYIGRFPLHQYVHRLLTWFTILTFLLCAIVVILEPALWPNLPGFLSSMVAPRGWPFENLTLPQKTDLILAITFMGMGGWACILYTTLTSLARYGIAGATDRTGAGA